MSLPQDSHAKTFQQQESNGDCKPNGVDSSTKSSDWLGSFDLSSSYLKTLEIYCLTKMGLRSKKCSSKLPKQGLMQSGQLFQRQMWVPAISENEFGFLPTPTARDYKDSGEKVNYKKLADKKRLAGVLVESCRGTGKASYLNPFFVEEMMGYPVGWTDLRL